MNTNVNPHSKEGKKAAWEKLQKDLPTMIESPIFNRIKYAVLDTVGHIHESCERKPTALAVGGIEVQNIV